MKKLPVRKQNYQFTPDLPRHYWMNHSLRTNFINALHVLFPAGERYFARILNRAAKEIGRPEIKDLAKSFAGQEIQHSIEHDKMLSRLEEMGYQVRGYEGALKWLLELVEENMPTNVNMAIIAGIEHFTALIGHIALEDKSILQGMHPDMQALLEWHAAEEIEHKAAAFDVNQALNDSYLLRAAGMVVAGVGVYGFISTIMVGFTMQDKKLFTRESLEDAAYLFFGEHNLFSRTFTEFLKYFKPGFHPDEVDDYYLAEEVLGQQKVAS